VTTPTTTTLGFTTTTLPASTTSTTTTTDPFESNAEWATVLGGYGNTAEGAGSFVGGGMSNAAKGDLASVVVSNALVVSMTPTDMVEDRTLIRKLFCLMCNSRLAGWILPAS